MLQALSKKSHIIRKEPDYEELLPEEEAAIEKGRQAYARGEWNNLNAIKNGMEGSRNKTRAKKP